MEEWREIPNTDGMFQVSNEGRIRSLLRGEPYILKTSRDKKGYHRIHLTYKRNRVAYKLHREVAKAFIPNPDNLPQVNHIDGNKDNNAVLNLEWCTNQYNARHAIENGLWPQADYFRKKDHPGEYHLPKKSKKVSEKNVISRRKGGYNPNPPKPIIGTNMEETRYFESIACAERFLNSRHIVDVLKGRRTHVKGWTFKYAERGEMGADNSIGKTTA